MRLFPAAFGERRDDKAKKPKHLPGLFHFPAHAMYRAPNPDFSLLWAKLFGTHPVRLCEAAGEILRLTIAAVHIPAVTASHVTRHPYERPAEVIVAALGALAGWHISLPVALLA